METGQASKLIGGILAITGLLGIIILVTDRILRASLMGQHWYALVVFIIMDFAVAAYVVVKPSKTGLTFSAAWSVLRIIIQLADVALAPALQMNYSDFANYLFNPTLITSPNPPGVPAGLIDLIIVLDLVVIGVALSGHSATMKATPTS